MLFQKCLIALWKVHSCQSMVKGCVVVLWQNESVNVNPGLGFSAWCSLACEHLLSHLQKMC